MALLILLRHGLSVWNKENIFTGWTDVPLAPEGEEEARRAGKLLLQHNILPEVAFTSFLKRAIKTTWLALEACDRMWIPVHKHWRLNERHYGALQGRNKEEVRREVGDDLYWKWRRSYDVPPPPLDENDPRHPRFDPRYADIPEELLPRAESLKDTIERAIPYWVDYIIPELKEGKTVLVSAHGNTLRGIIMELEDIPPEEIPHFEVPTGVPIIYDLDEESMEIKRKWELR